MTITDDLFLFLVMMLYIIGGSAFLAVFWFACDRLSILVENFIRERRLRRELQFPKGRFL